MSAVAKIGSGRRAAPKTAAPQSETEVLSVLDRMSVDPKISDERYKERIRFEEKLREDASKERARECRRAYDRAMTQMQPALPTVAERGKVTDNEGKVKHTYAEWEDIAEQFRPVLTEYGFNLTFRAAHHSGRVIVKAICAHDDGWREESESTQFYDMSDGKNGNQAVKSAESYGKRASATLLLNIITRGEDDDGARSMGVANEPCLTADQIEKIRSALTTYGRTAEQLSKALKVGSLEKLPMSRHDEALGLVHTLGRHPILRYKGDR